MFSLIVILVLKPKNLFAEYGNDLRLEDYIESHDQNIVKGDWPKPVVMTLLYVLTLCREEIFSATVYTLTTLP